MLATKRKLDSLVGSSASSGATSITDEIRSEQSRKRRRVPRAFARSDRDASRDAGISPVGAQPHLPTKPANQPAGLNLSVVKPAFDPWDREQFLKRLETYRDVTQWCYKPSSINELAWARRGWRCVGSEMVSCQACGRVRVVMLKAEGSRLRKIQSQGSRASLSNLLENQPSQKLPDSTSEAPTELEHANESPEALGDELDKEDIITDQSPIVKAYVDLIVEEHAEECLWRQRGCDEAIYHIPMSSSQRNCDQLRQRARCLTKSMKSGIPHLSLPRRDLDLRRTLAASREAENKEELKDQVLETGFLLALFGWSAQDNDLDSLIECRSCFRRVGLWLFRRAEEETSAEDDTPLLDPVSEHKEYCPWVNADSQNPGRSPNMPAEAGWHTLLRQIESEASKGSTGQLPADSDVEGDPIHVHGDEVGQGMSQLLEQDEKRMSRLRRLRRMLSTRVKQERAVKA